LFVCLFEDAKQDRPTPGNTFGFIFATAGYNFFKEEKKERKSKQILRAKYNRTNIPY